MASSKLEQTQTSIFTHDCDGKDSNRINLQCKFVPDIIEVQLMVESGDTLDADKFVYVQSALFSDIVAFGNAGNTSNPITTHSNFNRSTYQGTQLFTIRFSDTVLADNCTVVLIFTFKRYSD